MNFRNKPPKKPVVHFVRGGYLFRAMTSCSQSIYVDGERSNVTFSHDTAEVTCGSCLRTHQFRRAEEAAMSGKHESTVGIPTQGSESTMLERPINMGKVMTEAARIGNDRPTAEPLAGAMLGVPEANSFGEHEPLIHAMESRGHPRPLCNDVPGADQSGYSTMDGGAVNCRHCLQHPEFIRRNNMFTEMMSPTLADGERSPIAQVHDREPVDDYGPPVYDHDCEACTFLGHARGNDLYYCDQGGGSNISTVIARRSDRGEDYISGLSAARQEPLLALAVIRAFRKGLLTDDEMGWL